MKKTSSRRQFLSLGISGTAALTATGLGAGRFLTGAGALLGTAGGVAVASGTTHTVKAIGVKFDPLFVFIEPGDTVSWTQMIGHLIETIDTMVPDGTEKILTEMGADVAKTFDQPGIYMYKCTPHWGARMGGGIVVGKPENASATIDAYMATLETDRENLPAKGLLKKLSKEMEAKGML